VVHEVTIMSAQSQEHKERRQIFGPPAHATGVEPVAAGCMLHSQPEPVESGEAAQVEPPWKQASDQVLERVLRIISAGGKNWAF